MELILTILILITAALTVCYLLIHNSKSGKLIDKIPGPKEFPLIGSILEFRVPEIELWPLIEKWNTLYYPTYKLWFGHVPLVSICHPNDIEILASSQKLIRKSSVYDYLHSWLNAGLLTSDGKKWRACRKMLTPAFHYNLLHDFIGVFEEVAERMVDTLKKEPGEVVKDVVSLSSKYMLDAICEAAMGTVMQNEDPAQKKYRSSLKLFGEITFYRFTHPWLLYNWIFSLTRKSRALSEAVETLHGFTTEIIEKRKRYHEETGGQYLKFFSPENEMAGASVPRDDIPLKKKRLAMLDLLIATHKEHGTIDDLGIREQVDTFIFGGHDTTTVALTFATLLLAEHKDIQARARAEIDSILKESNGKLTMKELQSMVYLDCCIKESLRLYPPAHTIGRKLTEDMCSKNFVIPSGTNVFIQIHAIHRDPNFWPQPTVFDPDRFLPENIAGRHPFSYIPFSAGPRNCIGQKFAMLELKTFLALSLHNFYLEPMVELSTIHMIPDIILKTAESLKVKFVPVR